jgi:hypothetical protein
VAPEFSYYQDSTGNRSFVPVQGANNTMYWGTHLSNNLMRIYQWNESLPWNSIVYYDRSIPAWSKIEKGNGICPTGTNNSSNWCKREESALNMNGWVYGSTVGFIWNAAQGGKSIHNATFKWPYINGALFNITHDMKYIERPYIWSPDFAWADGYISPNNNGDLGIIAFFGGGTDNHPSLAAGIHKAKPAVSNFTTGLGKFWQMIPLIKGTNEPNEPNWGDYIRLRHYDNSSNLWIGTGYTLQGGDSDKFVEPRYFIFGPSNDEKNDKTKDNNINSQKAEENVNVSSIQGNTPIYTKISSSDKSCGRISGQYEVVLKDELMQDPANAKRILDMLSQKAKSSGVEVTNIFESIGIFVIKSSNHQQLDNVVNELKTDPNVKSINTSQCVGINSLE